MRKHIGSDLCRDIHRQTQTHWVITRVLSIQILASAFPSPSLHRRAKLPEGVRAREDEGAVQIFASELKDILIQFAFNPNLARLPLELDMLLVGWSVGGCGIRQLLPTKKLRLSLWLQRATT